MMQYNYLIVGAGFAGSVLAERLASQSGKTVLVIDKRSHVGGNCYDYVNKNGILVHKYGPHYFRTDSKDVFSYLSNFTDWNYYDYKIKTSVNGELFSFPLNRSAINKFFGLNLTNAAQVRNFFALERENISYSKNFEEYILSKYGRRIYESFIKNYTIKQWGIDPSLLDKSLCKRILIKTNDDDRMTTAKYQAMPKNGYSYLFENILDNPSIEVRINTDLQSIIKKIKYGVLIFTGQLDEFFGYKFGKLPYRSLSFKHENYPQPFFQQWSQINYPNDYNYTRVVEIKHVTGQIHPSTTIVKEYPRAGGEPLYPVMTEKSLAMRRKYLAESRKLKNTIFIGRLAQFQYLDMDRVVEIALDKFDEIKKIPQ